MAEFILECKCGSPEVYRKWFKGCANRMHWVIRCRTCNVYVETRKLDKAIEIWNRGQENDNNERHLNQ